ncbi:hypothetical protein ACOZ4N_04035 [Halorientalis pallida]|uniref:hypothetical protein n=1 Tax=Halorientalis pallida TaxID=2479928 RepID=UPI003C6FB55F
MRLRDVVGISTRTQARLSWAMEVLLVGILLVGLYRGGPGVVVNTVIALVVTQLPPVLERDFGLPMDPALTLWITTAVFLHALGTLGLPWSDLSFYQSIWWWDHLTHGLSASVVAAVGYATARSFDEHADGVVLPPKFMFVFILLFVLAFGVLWEVLEFLLTEITAVFGIGTFLTQYGLEDTMLDLVFDSVGAVLVATWGTAHLNDMFGALDERIEEWLATRNE